MADVSASFGTTYDSGADSGSEGGDGGAATNPGAGRDPALGAGTDSPDGRDAHGRAVYGEGGGTDGGHDLGPDARGYFSERAIEDAATSAWTALPVRSQGAFEFAGMGAEEVGNSVRYMMNSVAAGDREFQKAWSTLASDPAIGNHVGLVRAGHYAYLADKIATADDPWPFLEKLRPGLSRDIGRASGVDNRSYGMDTRNSNGRDSKERLLSEADDLMARGDYFRNRKAQSRVSEIYSRVYGTGGPDAAGNYNDR